ncbi:MAG: hypothetical protein CVU11_04575 [Bacteroidetes bacterium HGW-Bacteroidetes-6]|jgi:uncharacterized protein (DUF1697 family)|nr:MAG: hypothetical protein CVU11_04575 [Bacteroidetes bacterium HGW-Bacteroidetes-6]
MTQFIALLRSINVGGKNVIKMAELKVLFDKMGLSHVQTYIQSGNIVFESDNSNIEKLTLEIAKTLSIKLQNEIRLIVISDIQLISAFELAPKWFTDSNHLFKNDFVFVENHIHIPDLIPKISLREGVDKVVAGNGVMYFSRLIQKASSSRLSKIASLPEYAYMTIRNYNTISHLVKMVTSVR